MLSPIRKTIVLIFFALASCSGYPSVTPIVTPPTPTLTDTPAPPVIKEYFFDSNAGDDNAVGTSQAAAWKSLAKMNSYNFEAGDVINLKRGSFWTGGLVISRSGAEDHPIVFRAYGDGENPIFENPGDGSQHAHAVRINGSYIILEDILARNSSYSGFYISQNASHDIIRNVEVTNSGIGVAVNGINNLITNNYIHDLKMIVNDIGGGGNDYGAVGIEIFNGPNEISYNRLVDCQASSYDFGYDGGALEIYLNYGNADNSLFHHNYAERTDGFIEIHSRNLLYSADNITIAQNIAVSTKVFLDIGLPGYGGGHELKSAKNIKIEQNTYVDAVPVAQSAWSGSVFYFHEVLPLADQVSIRNNIIYAMNSWSIANGGFTHTNNIYYLNPQRTSLGFPLDVTEERTDPQFVDLMQGDFHLNPTSPAIDRGVNIGLTADYEGNLAPQGMGYDIGAYEYQPE